MAGGDAEGDATGLGRRDPVVQARAEAALRAVVRGLVGPAAEHAADAAAPDRDDHEVVVGGEALDIGRLEGRADDEVAAALLEVGHQPRQVEAVVDAHRRVIEVALEREVRPGDEVVVAGVAVLGDVPVVHAEGALALERVVVVRDRVQQPPIGDLLGGLVRVDRHGHVVRPQVQPEMQGRHARTDDSDSSHALSLAPCSGDSDRTSRRRSDQSHDPTASDAGSAMIAGGGRAARPALLRRPRADDALRPCGGGAAHVAVHAQPAESGGWRRRWASCC